MAALRTIQHFSRFEIAALTSLRSSLTARLQSWTQLKQRCSLSDFSVVWGRDSVPDGTACKLAISTADHEAMQHSTAHRSQTAMTSPSNSTTHSGWYADLLYPCVLPKSIQVLDNGPSSWQDQLRPVLRKHGRLSLRAEVLVTCLQTHVTKSQSGGCLSPR